MTLLISSILLVASSLFTGSLFEDNEIDFHHLTVDDGLPHSSIFAITEDSFGFIWFGTRAGLSRYDAFQFFNIDTIWINDHYENIGSVTQIIPGEDGNLWLVSKKHGLIFYNAAKEQVVLFAEGTLSKVSAIKKDKNDVLYWGSKNGMLGKISADRHKVTQLGKIKKGKQIKALEIDQAGALWVGTVNGLYKWTEETGFFNLAKMLNVPGPIDVWAMLADDNHLWIGSLQGLFKLSGILSGDLALNLSLNSKSKNGVLSKNLVRALAKDPEGKLWVGTGHGLATLENGAFERVHRDKLRPTSLSDRYFYSIYFDKHGNLWAGSYFGGVNVSYNKLSGYRHVFENFRKEGLTGKVVKCFLENGDEIWIGTEDAGVSIWNTQTGTWRYLNAKNGLNNNNIQTLLKDRKGRIWIGQFRGGITRISADGTTKRFLTGKNGAGYINSNIISFVKEDQDGKIWVGTFNKGLSYFDENSKSFVPYGNPKRLGSATDFVAYQGDYLVALNSGLAHLEKDTQKYTHITFKGKKLAVYSVFVQNGTIWLGTVGQGLCIGKIENNVFKVEKQLFPLETINSIVQDRSGNVWIATHQSLYEFDPAGNLLVSLNQAQGLKTYFNQSASYQMTNGALLLGGKNGFCIVNPEKIEIQPYHPRLMINELYVNFRKVRAQNDDILDQVLAKTDSVFLASHQNNITLEFISLQFAAKKTEEYYYRLVGLNEGWIPSGNQQRVAFTNLNPGEYIFEVTTKEGLLGKSVGQKASLVLVIAPPWWNTLWAYGLYILLLTGFLYLFRKYSIIRVEKWNAFQMEQLERKKQKEIYESRIKFFTNISHELRTPLTLIIGPLEEYIRQVKVEEESLTLGIIRKNAYRLLHLVNQILDFRKYDKNAMPLEVGRVDLLEVLREVKESFSNAFQLKQINFTITAPMEACIIEVDRAKIEQVFFNLVSNALNHTPEGGMIEVDLLFETNSAGKRLNITVSDSGVGIEPDVLDEIFTPFYSDPKRKGGYNSGIGLALVKEIIELHKGKIVAASDPGRGTSFFISLPVQNLANQSMSLEIVDTMQHTDPALTAAIPPKFLIDTGASANLLHTEDYESAERPQVLVVDDEKDVRDFLMTCLSPEYEVIVACNGVQGLSKAKELAPELVISDVGMPEMDGISLCKALKGNFITNNIPVILLTVHEALENQLEGVEIGADLYLTKPFHAELLREWVRNLLNNRRKLTESIRKEILLNPDAPAPISEKEVFLLEVKKIIEKNMADSRFGVEKLAEEMAISRTVIYRKFKQITGVSPKEYIRQSRLKRAAQLLAGDNDMTISEITYAVGYNDLKYFRETFQKKFGVSPSEYKL